MLLEILAGVAGVSGIGALSWRSANWLPSMGVPRIHLPPSILPAPSPALPEIPANPWTREDARNAAAMYREVPSAFWLAPEFTKYDGPEPTLLPPLPPMRLRKDRPTSRQDWILRDLIGSEAAYPNFLMGKRIISGWYDPNTMLFKIQLEGGEWVSLTHEMLDTHFRP